MVGKGGKFTFRNPPPRISENCRLIHLENSGDLFSLYAVSVLILILAVHILSANFGGLAETVGVHLPWVCCEEASEAQEAESSEVCNPFLLCQCCYGFLPQKAFFYHSATDLLLSHQSKYEEINSFFTIHLVWHPPRLRTLA